MNGRWFSLIVGTFWAVLPTCCLTPTVHGQISSNKTFKVDVNLVLVSATVTGPGGRFVTDLQPDDFVITEDMKEQELAVFRPTTSPFHVVLLLDISASTAAKLDLIQAAAVRFFDKLSPADEIALVEIADSPVLVEGFTRDRARLAQAVKKLGQQPSTSTKLYDSVVYALDNLLTEVKDRKAVVILSDACDNGSSANEHRMKRSVYSNDAVIYSLLVDTEQDQIDVLRQNLKRLSCVSLVLCADSRGSEQAVKQAARLLVEQLPQTSRVALYQNVYRRSLVNILPCEVSRQKIKQAIEESQPYCDSVLRSAQGGHEPDGDNLTVAIIESVTGAQDRIPVRAQSIATPLLVGGSSDLDIRSQISKIVGNSPADPIGYVQGLPETYRFYRSILASVSRTTGGTAFDLVKLEQVDHYYTQVAQELRTIYSLGYYSKDSTPFLRSVQVRVRKPGYTVKARQAYLPKSR